MDLTASRTKLDGEEVPEDADGWDDGAAVVLASSNTNVAAQAILVNGADEADEEEELDEDEEEYEEDAPHHDTNASKQPPLVVLQPPSPIPSRNAASASPSAVRWAIDAPPEDEEPEDQYWEEEEEDEEEEEEEENGDEEDGEDEKPDTTEVVAMGEEDKAEDADNWSEDERLALSAHRFSPASAADLGLQGEEMALLAEHLKRVEEGIRYAMRSLATSDALHFDPDVPVATVEQRRIEQEEGSTSDVAERDDDFFADVEPDPPSPRPLTSAPPPPPVPLPDNDDEGNEEDDEEGDETDTGKDSSSECVPETPLQQQQLSASSSISALPRTESPAPQHS